MLPQVLSNFASYALLRFEINVRGATVLGFVGAGGIGQDLIIAIRKFYYLRRQRHPAADHRLRHADRRRLGAAAPPAAVAGAAPVSDAPADLRDAFLARRAEIEAAHPHVFAADWRGAGGHAGDLRRRGAAVYAAGLVVLDVSPAAHLPRLVRGSADIVALMLPPRPGTWDRFRLYLDALGQTLSIALLGTLTAAVLVGAVRLPGRAQRGRQPAGCISLTRRGLDTVRSIDTLIWALIWINVVGLGPFAGALAIASSDFGAFAKLMSEAIEAADHRPMEGVAASGGGRLAAIRFGIVPQVLPVLASQVLYFFESNTRSATIIGVVGAGGIGLHLAEAIRVLEWQQTSFLILMVLVTVAAIDAVSRRLRAGIMG